MTSIRNIQSASQKKKNTQGKTLYLNQGPTREKSNKTNGFRYLPQFILLKVTELYELSVVNLILYIKLVFMKFYTQTSWVKDNLYWFWGQKFKGQYQRSWKLKKCFLFIITGFPLYLRLHKTSDTLWVGDDCQKKVGDRDGYLFYWNSLITPLSNEYKVKIESQYIPFVIMQQVQAAIEKNQSNKRLRNVLEKLQEYPNVPRKKKKFEVCIIMMRCNEFL